MHDEEEALNNLDSSGVAESSGAAHASSSKNGLAGGVDEGGSGGEMSKTQQKKAAKRVRRLCPLSFIRDRAIGVGARPRVVVSEPQARLAELRPQQRAAERERRKERHAYLAEGYANGTLSDADKAIYEARKVTKHQRNTAKRRLELGGGTDWGGVVVVDLGFDELMTEQASLAVR